MAYFFTTTTATTIQMYRICGNSTNTVCVWLNLFREVCTLAIEKEPQLVGTTEKLIQIDESFFGSRAKYGRGRRLNGNKFNKEAGLQVAIADQHENDTDESIHGRVHGPWVLGFTRTKRL